MRLSARLHAAAGPLSLRRGLCHTLVLLALAASLPANALDFAVLAALDDVEVERQLARADGVERAQLLIERARRLLTGDPQAAHVELTAARTLLARNDSLNLAYLETARCQAHRELAVSVDAHRSCLSAVAAARVSRDARALTVALGTLGNLHYDEGSLETAARLGEEALQKAEVAGDPTRLALALNDAGRFARSQGRFGQSLAFFSRGLDVADPQREPQTYRDLAFNVGATHIDIGQHARAREYFERLLSWTRETSNREQELLALAHIARADIGLDEPEAAALRLEAAVAEQALRENTSALVLALDVLGDAYLAAGQADRALERYREGIEVAASLENWFALRELRLDQGRALHALNQLAASRAILERLIADLREEGANELLAAALEAFSSVAVSQNDPATALTAFRESRDLTRALLGAVADQRLAFARAQLELDQKELALARAERDVMIRNGLAGLGAALVIIGYLFYSRRVQARLASTRREEAEKLEQIVRERTSALQQQLNRRAEADEQRLQLERRLAEDDKRRILGQLTGGVAHDFNNLLTVVMGAAEVLRLKLEKSDKKVLELLDHIVAAAHSGAGITRSLMSYARQQPLKLEAFDLTALLEERLPLIQRTVGSALRIELVIATTEVLEAVLDRDQLTTALLNLTINARDAQELGGSVTIELERHDARTASITVADRGRGMTEEQVVRAVEPFYSTKDEEGTGLGLSMVYGFTKQLGGELEIESQEGFGTRVSMLLPLVEAGAARKAG